jgi:hypothetical protein
LWEVAKVAKSDLIDMQHHDYRRETWTI